MSTRNGQSNGTKAAQSLGSNEFPEFAHTFASSMQQYIQTAVKKAVQQETSALHAEIEDLKAHVNALEVELKCAGTSINGMPPKGELFKANVIKYIKLEDEEDEANFMANFNNNNAYDEEENYEDEDDGSSNKNGEEDLEDYEPQTVAVSKKRVKRSTPQSTSSGPKHKRWRARVDDVIFDDSKIGPYHYDYDGQKFDLTAMVRAKTPNSFTNTAITSAAKDITKYFLSMIIGDGHLHLYTSSSRTRRSYEPIPVELQNQIKDLVFEGAVSYSKFDESELKKCITNAVETAIYDKCSYARKHPEKRARLENE